MISSKDSACCRPACNSGPHSLTGISPQATLHVHRSAHPSTPSEISSLCMNPRSFVADAPRQCTPLRVVFCDSQLTVCIIISVEPLSSFLIPHRPHLLGLLELHLRSCHRHLGWNIVSPSPSKAVHRNVEVWVVPQIRCRVLHPVPQGFWRCLALQSMRETCLCTSNAESQASGDVHESHRSKEQHKWVILSGLWGRISRRMTDSSSTDGT